MGSPIKITPVLSGSSFSHKHAHEGCNHDLLRTSKYTVMRDFLLMAQEYSERFITGSACQLRTEIYTSSTDNQVLEAQPSQAGNMKKEPPGAKNGDSARLVDPIHVLIRRANDHSLQSKTQVLAAIDLSFILVTRHGSAIETDLIESIKGIASTIISLLSTASVITSSIERNKVFRSLCQLAVSPHFRVKMVKRRCTMMAITRNLSHPDSVTRRAALIACTQLLDDEDCRSILSRGAGENVEILRVGIVESAFNARDSNIQLLIVSALEGLVHVLARAPNDILDILHNFAYDGASIVVTIKAAITLSRSVDHQVEGHMVYLAAVVEFTTFQSPQVRHEALAVLEAMTSSSNGMMYLLTTTKVVENAIFIIQRGSKQDRSEVLNIMRQLARSSLYHQYLLGNSDFLPSVVEVVISDHAEGCKTSNGYAEEIILSLLSNEENMEAFLPCRQLLPWIRQITMNAFFDEPSKQRVSNLIAKLDDQK